MKTAYICMDVESFFDTVCIKEHNITPDTNYDCAEEVEHFLDYLNLVDVKATFFVNVGFLDRCESILVKARESGHEIALHSLKHISPVEQTIEEFSGDLDDAKRIIKERLGVDVKGYRAPCFGISDEKVAAVRKRFLYDSSALNYKDAPESGIVDLDGFKRVNDALFEDDGFYEYPVVQRRLLGKKFPISGGGYVRLMAWWLIRRAIFRHIKRSNGYMFYVHPFEISTKEFPKYKGLGFWNSVYINKGRKSYFKKIKSIIEELKKEGYSFKTMSQSCEGNDGGERKDK